MSQHAALTLERWREFGTSERVLPPQPPARRGLALHALLLLDRVAARQRPYVLPRALAAASSSR